MLRMPASGFAVCQHLAIPEAALLRGRVHRVRQNVLPIRCAPVRGQFPSVLFVLFGSQFSCGYCLASLGCRHGWVRDAACESSPARIYICLGVHVLGTVLLRRIDKVFCEMLRDTLQASLLLHQTQAGLAICSLTYLRSTAHDAQRQAASGAWLECASYHAQCSGRACQRGASDSFRCVALYELAPGPAAVLLTARNCAVTGTAAHQCTFTALMSWAMPARLMVTDMVLP